MVQQVTSQSERNVRGRVEKGEREKRKSASERASTRERERERDKRETQGELKLDSAI